MTDHVLVVLGTPVFICALALLTNIYREHRRVSYQLKPNCLLTRNPVVFITGPRSLFYFRKYWNAYPEILAEHGYQVFTLHLPWRGPKRQIKFHEFIMNSSAATQNYHFICDAYTAEELKKVFEQFSSSPSITVLGAALTQDVPQTSSYFLNWVYKLHIWSSFSRKLPSPQDLGLHVPASLPWLLERMQEKGEQDFLL